MGAVPGTDHPFVPSIGAILLIITSQGWQNALQKAHQFTLTRHCAWIPYIYTCSSFLRT